MAASPDFLDQSEIKAGDPDFAHIYKNIQGNILKGHGRDHAVMILLRFRGKYANRARKHLAAFADAHVTDFYRQLWERERYKRNQIPGNIFGNVFISQKGYEFLEPNAGLFGDKAFQKGMRESDLVNDPEDGVERWHRKDIHAMLLLADDDTARLNTVAKEVLDEFEKISDILHVEYGDAIRNANGDGLEHNGYVDGISQPLFLKDEVDEYKKRHGIKDDYGDAFDPRAKPGLVLIEDPLAPAGAGHYGSYFVFRKLEQNVRDFKHNEEKIGKRMYKEEEQRERAGAMLVGRFEDGTPVQLQGEDHMIGSGAFNNFNYENPPTNPAGGKCPYFAHIRKVNPRKDGAFNEHAIARRGIPFGCRNVSTEMEHISRHQNPQKGVGLLFMCFQRSILNQFVVLQNMANNAGSNGHADDGVDPVIGQNKRSEYEFPADDDMKPDAVRNHEFPQRTFFRGGEYFFAPSMIYLKKLALE